MDIKVNPCPRCGGTDIYWAKRNVIKGAGGVFMSGEMVDTPLCKACGETCTYDKKEYKAERRKELIATQPKLSNGFILIVFAIFIVALLLMG